MLSLSLFVALWLFPVLLLVFGIAIGNAAVIWCGLAGSLISFLSFVVSSRG